MATADELKLREGEIVKIGNPIYEELSEDSVFSIICGARWCHKDLEIGKGPKVRVLKRRRKETLVEYLECWVNGPDVFWKNERQWVDIKYIGFGRDENKKEDGYKI